VSAARSATRPSWPICCSTGSVTTLSQGFAARLRQSGSALWNYRRDCLPGMRGSLIRRLPYPQQGFDQLGRCLRGHFSGRTLCVDGALPSPGVRPEPTRLLADAGEKRLETLLLPCETLLRLGDARCCCFGGGLDR
jgi:hypothetical protein